MDLLFNGAECVILQTRRICILQENSRYNNIRNIIWTIIPRQNNTYGMYEKKKWNFTVLYIIR